MAGAWAIALPLACQGADLVAAPKTAAGKVMAAWLSAHSANDKAQWEAYKKQHEPGIDVEGEMSLRQATGGFDLLRIVKSEPRKVTALIKQRDDDQILQMDVSVKSKQPALVDKFMLQGLDAPADLLPKRLTFDQALAETDAKADAQAKAGDFSGVLLIARNGKVLHIRQWGLADHEHHVPITADTRFRIASMGKMFTAISVLQLVEAGKLSLDKTVGDYLSDYPNKDVARLVTVRQLLDHTGGTGDIFTPEYDKRRAETREVADYLKLFGDRKPAFKPGAEDGYSNYGYVLLGALIEKVSGQNYYDYVREHIWQPAGMNGTGAQPEAEIADKVAVGYTRDDNDNTKFVSNADTLPYRGSPAGGGYATAGDLLKFVQALQAGQLLPAKWVDEATKPQNNKHWYGYGFMVGNDGGAHWYGHEGGAPGMNATLLVYPQSGYVVICLGNTDPPAAGRVAQHFAHRMPL